MRKLKKGISMTLLCAIGLLSPTMIFAAEEPTIISEEQITLSSSSLGSKGENNTKEFTLKIYNDNGAKVYGLDVEDLKYRQSAAEYLNMLTGDPGEMKQVRGPLLPGESEYQNDIQTHDKAKAIAWKRNTATKWDNEFEGGLTASWEGSSPVRHIVLNQNVKVGGIFATVSWPPGFSGSNSSASWVSSPIFSNVAARSFEGMTVEGTAYSCTFSEGGDVYVGSSVFSPMTYIKFSYFS